MAENDTPSKETKNDHSEPMTAEMQAAVDASGGGEKEAPKKAASKKKAPSKTKAAPKKKSAVKKKAAPKKKAVPKKKSAVKKKASPKKSRLKTTATSAVTEKPTKSSPVSQPPATEPEKVPEKVVDSSSTEDLQHQQQLRQKLVDLGVADAEEIGAVAHEAHSESSRPFWIKAIIILMIIVGFYFYSKGSNDSSTTSISSTPTVSPIENSAQKDSETTEQIESEPTTSADLADHSADAPSTDKQPSLPNEESKSETVTEESLDNEEQGSATEIAVPAPTQQYYMPGYIAPNQWSPNYYPPFNPMNQMSPAAPYYNPNMAPGFMPPPYYTYPPTR